MFSKSNIHLQPVGWPKSQVSDNTPSPAIIPKQDLLTSTLLLTPKRFLEGCMRTALTGAAAVGRHHHRVDPLVLDNVLPVDGVSVTQELVLVDVHASAQDLCGERERKIRGCSYFICGIGGSVAQRHDCHWEHLDRDTASSPVIATSDLFPAVLLFWLPNPFVPARWAAQINYALFQSQR